MKRAQSPRAVTRGSGCSCRRRRCGRTGSLALLGVLVALVSSGRAFGESRELVERALNGIEHIPSREELQRLDPAVDEVLRQIALRPSRRALAQNRAITLLRLFPSARTAATLRRVIQTTRATRPGVALLNLEQALVSYAVVAGPAALDLVRPYLAHGQLDVRHAAAGAVRLTGHPRARIVLLERQQVERDPLVRHELGRQIELLSRPRAEPGPSAATSSARGPGLGR